MKRALVVDDSKLARLSLGRLLQKLGLGVDTAESGKQALEQLTTGALKPDIIFMDYMMPEMDGYETTRSIAGDPRVSSIPVVMCTSQEDTPEERAKARENGARGYLKKPVTEEKLKQILHDESIVGIGAVDAEPRGQDKPPKEEAAAHVSAGPTTDLAAWQQQVEASARLAAEQSARAMVDRALADATAQSDSGPGREQLQALAADAARAAVAEGIRSLEGRVAALETKAQADPAGAKTSAPGALTAPQTTSAGPSLGLIIAGVALVISLVALLLALL